MQYSLQSVITMNTHKYRDHRMLMNGLILKKLERQKWKCKIFQIKVKSNKNELCIKKTDSL